MSIPFIPETLYLCKDERLSLFDGAFEVPAIGVCQRKLRTIRLKPRHADEIENPLRMTSFELAVDMFDGLFANDASLVAIFVGPETDRSHVMHDAITLMRATLAQMCANERCFGTLTAPNQPLVGYGIHDGTMWKLLVLSRDAAKANFALADVVHACDPHHEPIMRWLYETGRITGPERPYNTFA